MKDGAGRSVPVHIVPFDSGRSVHWIDDHGLLRIVAVSAADGSKTMLPGAPVLGDCLGQEMPAELVQGTIDHWSHIREMGYGPWIFASQTTVVTYDRRDGRLLAVKCPGVACQATPEVSEGRMVAHGNPATLELCDWGGTRVLMDIELPIGGDLPP
ncbi:hypothetical protein [Nocardia jiangsuensis]|uniref:Uncharacterized protein n=1 Tax=Nocardia jiangsuensis TaxID=1691563 RepID=A0ABV8DQG8_9NOCA